MVSTVKATLINSHGDARSSLVTNTRADRKLKAHFEDDDRNFGSYLFLMVIVLVALIIAMLWFVALVARQRDREEMLTKLQQQQQQQQRKQQQQSNDQLDEILSERDSRDRYEVIVGEGEGGKVKRNLKRRWIGAASRWRSLDVELRNERRRNEEKFYFALGDHLNALTL
ncbi:unnamed protein product [Anisakis simplex]|uniref:Transmembrane protein n=1 Tax=Anisakis simplex TaxID=6269 RepID=A0A0M3K5U8_ANISI|nr:unnamed protein product [Anisakis simplex]